MKRFFAMLLASLMVLGCVIRASADEGKMEAAGITEASRVTASDVMTYDEMLEYMVEKGELPFNVAAHSFPAENALRRSGTYRVFSITLSVDGQPSYKPTLDFYCEVEIGYGQMGIKNIYAVMMNRNSNGVVKQFSGDVSFWLRTAEKIEYIVNGDFYNTGTTTVSGNMGLNVTAGGYGSFVSGVSSTVSSNYFAYCYQHGTEKVI